MKKKILIRKINIRIEIYIISFMESKLKTLGQIAAKMGKHRLLERAADTFINADSNISEFSNVAVTDVENWFSGGHWKVYGMGSSLPPINTEDVAVFILHGCILLSTDTLTEKISIPIFKSMFLKHYPEKKSRQTFGAIDYVTAVPTLTWELPREEYERGLDHIEIMKAMLRLRYNELSHTRALTILHAVGANEQKLARFLFYLFIYASRRVGDHLELAIRQSDLAHVCGMQRTYIVTILEKMEAKKIIERGYRKIRLIDDQAFLESAGFPLYPEGKIHVFDEVEKHRQILYND